MKKGKLIPILITIQTLLIAMNLEAQSIFDFGKFPVSLNSEEPLETSKLLKELDWEAIKKYAKNNEGHYAYERIDSLRTEYEYVQQGRVASFKIISFDGKVLEFYSEITNTSKPSRISYFDKNVWLLYVDYKMPNLEDRFKISISERKSILKAYYTLIGVDSPDEYGWICEYSTVGMATKRRRAVIELRLEKEMLINLLEYPNVQTQLYAADGLIFMEYSLKQEIKQSQNKDYNKYLRSERLSKKIWNKIYELRDSNSPVQICGNSGSYKLYPSTTSEQLSNQAIEEIPKKYEWLSRLGYLKLSYVPN